MWRIPYICLSILILCTSWYQAIGFGFLGAVFASFVMWLVYRWRLRQVAKRLAQRVHIVRELQDTMLQTIQGSRFVADAALEKSNDPTHMRLAMEKLSTWLGQAIQEGQEALNSLPTSTVEENDN